MAENNNEATQHRFGPESLRPALLDAYFAPLSSLKGVGPKLARPLANLLCEDEHAEARLLDLLFHRPSGAIDRRLRTRIADAPIGAIVTLEVCIEEHRPPPRVKARIPYRVVAGDETGELLLVYFSTETAWIARSMPVGARRIISGTVEIYDGIKQIAHPALVGDPDKPGSFAEVEPSYPLTAGINSRLLQRLQKQALARAPALPEWLPPEAADGRPGFAQALRSLHEPKTPADCAPDSPGGLRLALDSFFASQLALALVRRATLAQHGRPITGDGRLVARLVAALPYCLTGAQQRALAAIHADMAKPAAMLHLLQGDVGSGKTVVAMLAMARAIEGGRQAALMAPTDLLARQHYQTILPYFEAAGRRLAFLAGRGKAAERRNLIKALRDGAVDAVIGTHALFQEEVEFRDLGLAVIDEQHRFGVEQRLALTAKGEAVDLLVTTATPIPRTLVLAYYGDMDVSKLDEKPQGRLPILTRTLPLTRMGEVIDGLSRAIASGARAYWVCPSIAEENGEETGVEQRAVMLESHFPGRVGLLHGKLTVARREAALSAFAAGQLDILVATTVIEVGVDVPAATIIVIENAERFGLSQLHQLRGRVGRGEAQSSCLLLYSPDLSETARERLRVIRDSDDGFYIAEADLKLRGPGEVLGTRQSGLPSLPMVAWEVHADLLPLARRAARQLVDDDPGLQTPLGRSARLALYLFGQHQALRLIAAG